MSKLMPHKIEIKADKIKAGALDYSSVKASIEEGEIIGIGADITLPLKVGDKIKFKSYGLDTWNDGTLIIDERTLAIAKKI